jgi:uncharacterized repeat protein (TIGR03803 family)
MSKLTSWKTIPLFCVLCAVAVIGSPAQTFKTLQSFNNTDGAYPSAGLVQATNGNLYGTTSGGGANSLGTVFRTTLSGTLTTLYSFCAQTSCLDGQGPSAALVPATNGSLYGTTFDGGAYFFGTVFKITPAGALTTLHSFCSPYFCADGGQPEGGLVQATNGNFYGATFDGGANTSDCEDSGCGMIFEITPTGTLTVLHSFDGTDGQSPLGSLVQATDANFYGTTRAGGANGSGTVFKITPTGTLTTLHSFCSLSGCADGEGPSAGLIQATDGNFYSTTSGGANGYGTVFKITPTGTLTTLHSFCSVSGCADGEYPSAGLIQATDGNFYGTTTFGGANGYGTVFKITPAGTLITLYNFCSQTGCSDGTGPTSMVQDTDGIFYGTTGGGGANSYGTVFSLSVNLGPFVETLPTSGKVGTAVIILGNNLTGASSVTFNGAAATFTVVSSTEIKTTVPSGATTGKVKVTTPSRTLTSNVNFRVP